MRVAVVGSGYVGLVTGVGLAHVGHDVVCVDRDQVKVDQVNSAEPPIHEDGLGELLEGVVGLRLRASTDLGAAVASADVTMICVGTPFGEDRIDLDQVRAAANDVGVAMSRRSDYSVVVVKSTVVPGTTEQVVLPILEQASGRRAGADFGVGMNPEFLREGVAVDDFMNPDRIVLGGIDDRTIDVMQDMYAAFGNVDIVRTRPSTAEMIKYTSNALLATMISFSNEIANLSSTVGVDAAEVMSGLHLDRRLSPMLEDGSRVTPGILTYLEGGCGFGGSCFGKDVRALTSLGAQHGHAMRMLESTMYINDHQPQVLVELLEQHEPRLDGLRVALLGLAFKPGTDDVRESPALTIARGLCEAGSAVIAYDPIAAPAARKVLGDRVDYATSLESALESCDAVIIVTSWPEFGRVPELLATRAHQPVVIDGRRMLDADSVERYAGIGLP